MNSVKHGVARASPGLSRLLIGAALAALAAGVAQAATPENPLTERMDYYFQHPDAPDTFRALTGQGDPVIEPAYRGFFYIGPSNNPDTPFIRRLFPKVGDFGFFAEDCRPAYAIEVLKSRIAAYGPDHPYVRQWVEAQRSVFAACSSRNEPDGQATSLPPPLAIEDPALARLQAQDRAYQAASLAFYGGDLPGALATFTRIAHTDSPHRGAAMVMVAAIGAGSGGDGPDSAKVKPAQSIAALQAILDDPSLASAHLAAREEIGWIGATVSDSASRQAQVQGTLADLETPAATLAQGPQARQRYALARSDIDQLHEASRKGDPAWWLTSGPPADYTASQAMMNAARTDPMAAWVLFPAPYLQGHAWAPFAAGEPPSWGPLAAYAATAAKRDDAAAFAWMRIEHAISRRYDPGLWAILDAEEAQAQAGDQRAIAALSFDFYHQVRLALSRAPAKSSDPAAFETALAQMRAFPFKDTGPYFAARHDALQYLMTVGRLSEARRWRDQLLQSPDGSPSWADQGDVLLQILAEDQSHFIAALGAADRSQALALQNDLSISALRQIAADPRAPADIRAKFARIAWSRTYALGRTVDADLNRRMRALNPIMVAGWTARADQPVRPGDRDALLDVLRSPGVNILIVDTDRDQEPGPAQITDPGNGTPGQKLIDLYNHDDDNWWCAWDPAADAQRINDLLTATFVGTGDMDLAGGQDAYDLRAHLKPVLAASYAFRHQDSVERDALSHIPCAPKLLTGRVLDWVRSAGRSDPQDGQAEALALSIRTTRYGCYSDGPRGAYSKAAWRLLHQRFATTPWAIQSKYWFN